MATNLTPDRIRVLHVDDDPAFLELAATYVEREIDGIDVVTETDVDAGLDRIASDEVDCVVSDYDMPRTDGIEFLEAVRERKPELPFILYTGKGSEEVASQAIAAGATDYLQKESGTEQYTILANRIENVVSGERSRRALVERNQQLETLVDNLPGIVYRARNDDDWTFMAVEGECRSLTGYSASKLRSGSVTWGSDVIHPDDQDRVWERVQSALEADEQFELTYRIRTRDDDVKWVWERGVGINADDGTGTLEGFITEVTGRKKNEREQQRYRQLVDAFRESACIYDREGRYKLVNEFLADWHDSTPEELVGERSPVIERLREGETDPFRELVDGERETFRGEVTGKFGTDDPVTIDLRLSRLIVDGEFEGIVSSGRDVTERKRRERALEEANTVLRTVLDALPMGVLVEDADRTILAANDALLDVLDIPGTVEDMKGRNCAAAARTVCDQFSEPDQFVERIDELLAAREPVLDETIELTDGRTLERDYIPYTHPNGDANLWIYRDVTEAKEREQRLQRQNDRLDEFASVISHDLRNPLNVAEGRLELARAECESEHLEQVASAHQRIEALIDDLLTLARYGEAATDVSAVDLSDVTRQCWQHVETHTATLVVEASGAILADESRLQQLLENLTRNSVEHGSEGVTVTVGDLDDGFYVEDDGPGIAADERDRIFESGYSMSDDGTGFGLSIIEEIVDAHGWSINVTESDSGGARFEITGVDRPE